MGDRQSANLRSIATIGFDRPVVLSATSVDVPHPSHDEHSTTSPLVNGVPNKPKNPDPPTTSLMDHPKLIASNFHYLKGVDLSIPALASELGFAEAVATRNNPTTLENLHRKLTILPPNFSTLTKEQQEAFCRLVDSAEMKQALRLELRSKERNIREQEMKYLSTDFGLGNVVHGWDLSSGSNYTGTERTASSSRLISRRKVKDSERVFSASSVMSFLTNSRVSRVKRTDTKKRRKQREKIKKQRKKQLSLQRHRLNAGRDKDDSEEESLAGDERNYTLPVGKEMDAQEEASEDSRDVKEKVKKKSMGTLKKLVKSSASREPTGAGKTSQGSLRQESKIMKNVPPPKLEKSSGETGHRLRTLLTNKAPHASSSGVVSQPVVSAQN